MKHYKVIFDKKEIDGIDVYEDDMVSAKKYVNLLIQNFESYGFNVKEV